MMINKDKRILEYREPTDHALMLEYISVLCGRYGFLRCSDIGFSLCGRAIPALRIGNGDTNLLYVGTHHACEWITCTLLLRFVNDFCEFCETGRRVFDLNLRSILDMRSVFIVPMLNPDGAELSIHGSDAKNPLTDRLLTANGGSTDFSRWSANGRGVDLNHNYDCGFEEYRASELSAGRNLPAPSRFCGQHPLSEPESAALASLINTLAPRAVISLHSQGEVIYGAYRSAPRSSALGQILSKLTGYSLQKPEGGSGLSGLCDWYCEEFCRPAFTLECGRGENPLPLSQFFPIYARLREALFTLPVLI